MKKCILLYILTAFFVLSYPIYAHAFIGLCCGKCGGNMPMNIPGGGCPETHEFRFKLSPLFMKMDGLRNGTDSVEPGSILGMPTMMGKPTGKFMAVPTDMDMYMTNLTAGYSFTDNFFGGIMFMWMRKDMDMRFNSTMKMMTGQDGFTMKSNGMGDTMIMTKYRLYANDPLIPTKQVSLLLALSMPTGSIDEKNSEHPLAARKAEQLPYGMQPGSGTFDPKIGILYQGSTSPLWWGVNLTYTPRVYRNSRDYNMGDEFHYDLYGMYQLRYNFVAELQLNGKWWNHIEGEMDEAVSGASGRATQGDPASPYATSLWDPHNYGGNQISVTAGIQWQPLPLNIVDLQVGVPVYRDLNGPQLEEDYRVMLTWYLEIPTPSSIRYKGEKKGIKSKLGF